MALPKSSLSQVCKAMADFVKNGIKATTVSTRVMIGNPAAAVPAQTDTEHRVNFFFYRIEPAGLFTGDTPGDPSWLRLQCLVTAFGIAEENSSAGENDLRLLGEVIRVFHENPVLPELTVEDETFRIQVVFLSLGIDDLNHVWSTQGDVSYRPSVVYEMALTPVIPKERRREGPLAGSIGSEVRAAREGRTAAFKGAVEGPEVVPARVNTSDPGWAPLICFVIDGRCAQSLVFEKKALAGFTPGVWVAGEPGADVQLAWQHWTSGAGWQDVAGTKAVKASDPAIEPDSAGTAITESVDLPAGFDAGQAVLYAQRRYERASDNAQITVKSNPLLVTVYRGS